MTAIGRVASAVVVLAVLALIVISTILPGLMHVGPVHVVDWFGAMIYLGAPVAWVSAIAHGATHFPPEGPRARWGLVAIVGLVPGAVAYWFWGARHAKQVD